MYLFDTWEDPQLNAFGLGHDFGNAPIVPPSVVDSPALSFARFEQRFDPDFVAANGMGIDQNETLSSTLIQDDSFLVISKNNRTASEEVDTGDGSGFVDDNHNGVWDAGEEIVVTATRVDDGGAWQLGVGIDGLYGQISVSNLDVFFGIGAGRPGWNFDYESEADLTGLEVDPTNITYNIGTLDIYDLAVDTVDELVTTVDGMLDSISREMVDYMYGPVIDRHYSYDEFQSVR